MKKLTLAIAALTLLTTAAFAETKNKPEDFLPDNTQVEVVSVAIAQNVIDKFCNEPAPKGKPGDIVIYYVRDNNQVCVGKVKVVR